jgi:glycosyltransferase involved in cell wall biosynthesis
MHGGKSHTDPKSKSGVSAPQSIIYASYDRFPAPKGAAVHIDAFTRALAAEFGPVDLVAVAGAGNDGVEVPDASASRQFVAESPSPVRLHLLPAVGGTLIERVLSFRHALRTWWGQRRPRVAHVRSIFEGYPLIGSRPRCYERLVWEVNALPSIELKYHYPQVADDPELLAKLTHQEQVCLEAADLLITVSEVTAEHLASRGAERAKIRVIPNGVDLDLFPYTPPRDLVGQELRLLYVGTLSPWQGVNYALEALALYLRDAPARLTLVGDARPRQRRECEERAIELGLRGRVEFLRGCDQRQLAALHAAHDVALAPLTANDRNLVQGCCPLKVLEAMAAGNALVASDLPVVAALARNEQEALLVRPGSAKAIKDGLLRLAQTPGLAHQLSAAARARVAEQFTWERAQRALVAAYRELLDG